MLRKSVCVGMVVMGLLLATTALANEETAEVSVEELQKINERLQQVEKELKAKDVVGAFHSQPILPYSCEFERIEEKK